MRRLVLLSMVVFLSFGTEVSARPGWFFPVRGQQHRGAVFQGHMYRTAPSYQETYHYLNARYPKYIGGFHSNFFRDIGVPPGDVGIRGNGLYAFPW